MKTASNFCKAGAADAHFGVHPHRISKKLEGGVFLPEIGYIDVNAYTSNARIPLENVAITVTSDDGTAIAMRLTDRNGRIRPIEVPVPELSAGQTPDTGIRPYTPVNLYARLEGFEQLENENLQVFPETVTQLDLQMIPLSELPGSWDQIGITNTPPQNL